MLGLLIILIAVGMGFCSGYAVREMESRRRRRIARGDAPAVQPQRRAPPVAGAGRDDLMINLEGLLVAANGSFSGRRKASRRTPQVDPRRQPDEFDGAVRDLLGELNRRPSAPSPHPVRQ